MLLYWYINELYLQDSEEEKEKEERRENIKKKLKREPSEKNISVKQNRQSPESVPSRLTEMSSQIDSTEKSSSANSKPKLVHGNKTEEKPSSKRYCIHESYSVRMAII